MTFDKLFCKFTSLFIGQCHSQLLASLRYLNPLNAFNLFIDRKYNIRCETTEMLAIHTVSIVVQTIKLNIPTICRCIINKFASLYVADRPVVCHSDIDWVEAIIALLPYAYFECCHTHFVVNRCKLV